MRARGSRMVITESQYNKNENKVQGRNGRGTRKFQQETRPKKIIQ